MRPASMTNNADPNGGLEQRSALSTRRLVLVDMCAERQPKEGLREVRAAWSGWRRRDCSM
jgi:hypothetical protein